MLPSRGPRQLDRGSARRDRGAPLCLAARAARVLPGAERGCALAASGALVLVRASRAASPPCLFGAPRVPSPTAAAARSVAVGVFWSPARDAADRGLGGAVRAAVVFLELEARRSRLAAASSASPSSTSARATRQSSTCPTARPCHRRRRPRREPGRHGRARARAGCSAPAGARAVAARRPLSSAPRSLRRPASRARGSALGALWDTGQGEAEGAGGDTLRCSAAPRAGVPVSGRASSAERATIGGARVEVLAPCPRPNARPRRRTTTRSSSASASATAPSSSSATPSEPRRRSSLRTGRASLRADVLKVGHHGSRTSSTPAFLEAVASRMAVISCGVRNRFGHPAPDTLADARGAQRARPPDRSRRQRDRHDRRPRALVGRLRGAGPGVSFARRPRCTAGCGTARRSRGRSRRRTCLRW